jgi:hypothetical protein
MFTVRLVGTATVTVCINAPIPVAVALSTFGVLTVMEYVVVDSFHGTRARNIVKKLVKAATLDDAFHVIVSNIDLQTTLDGMKLKSQRSRATLVLTVVVRPMRARVAELFRVVVTSDPISKTPV